jgi:Domain of unknown function (DUF3846)
MRAIIINSDSRMIVEADIDGRLPKLQEIVGGHIDTVYAGLDQQHHCYVNDEGLLDNPQHFFLFRDGHQPLAGNGVILGSTADGDEAPCTLDLDWVKRRVTFMARWQVELRRHWIKAGKGSR